MKYHALLTANPGLNPLPYNPCQLLDFNLLKLAAGEKHSAHSGGREILAVILGGQATFTVNGAAFGKVGGRPNVFSGKPHSVYIPAGAEYAIEAAGAVEMALASAPSDETAIAPYVIAPHQVANGVWGAANSGFRAPTLTELYRQFSVGAITTRPNENLAPERLVGGEAGINVAPAKNVSIRLTYFVNRLTNPVLNVTTSATRLASWSGT